MENEGSDGIERQLFFGRAVNVYQIPPRESLSRGYRLSFLRPSASIFVSPRQHSCGPNTTKRFMFLPVCLWSGAGIRAALRIEHTSILAATLLFAAPRPPDTPEQRTGMGPAQGQTPCYVPYSGVLSSSVISTISTDTCTRARRRL